MNKLEQIEVAIRALPDDFDSPRRVLLALAVSGQIHNVRVYARGLLDAGELLSDDEEDEAILTALRKVDELLK